MDTDQNNPSGLEELNDITEAIIGGAYRVANVPGSGCLEKVCENALAHEVAKKGLGFEQQKSILVRYDGVVVGEYVADLLVEGQVLVELKVAKALDDIYMAQCLNYLKGTSLRLCLLINFGSYKFEIRKFVWTEGKVASKNA